jgi:hypothetical protein
MTGLFSHLAGRFSAGAENLATEALLYLLRGYEPLRSEFTHLLEQHTGVALPTGMNFRTQAGSEDGSIPDLIAESEAGRQLIVEAKFWAGLTGNQPRAYLEQLPVDSSALLLFLVPEARVPTIRAELRRRLPDLATEGAGTAFKARLGCTKTGAAVAVMSWRSVLSRFRAVAEDLRDRRAMSDVAQLEGLCDRMDAEGFLPLQSAELGPGAGRRVMQLCALTDRIAQELMGSGLADGRGMRSAAGAGWYGRYLALAGHVVLVHFSAPKWGSVADTPLWLGYYADYGKVPVERVRSALSFLEAADPRRLFRASRGEGLEIPLFIPIGAEQDEVVESILVQVRAVHERLARLQDVGEQITPDHVAGQDSDAEPVTS